MFSQAASIDTDTFVRTSRSEPSSFHRFRVKRSPLVCRDRVSSGVCSFPSWHRRGQMRGDAIGSPSPEAARCLVCTRRSEANRAACTFRLCSRLPRGFFRQLGHARLHVASWLRVRMSMRSERNRPGRSRFETFPFRIWFESTSGAEPEALVDDGFPHLGCPGSSPDGHWIFLEYIPGGAFHPSGTAEMEVSVLGQVAMGEWHRAEHDCGLG